MLYVWAVRNPLLFLFRDEGSSCVERSHSTPALWLTHKLADMTPSSGILQQARLNPRDCPSQARKKKKNLTKSDSFFVVSDYKCVNVDHSLMQEGSISTSILVEGESRHCETFPKWNLHSTVVRSHGFKGSCAVHGQWWLGHLCSLGTAWGTVTGTLACLVDHRCIKHGDVKLSQHLLPELHIWI